MIHHIQIDDKANDAKNLLLYLRNISKSNRYIDFLTEKQVEELEDNLLLQQMKSAKKTELLSENKKNIFLSKLKKVATK